MSFGNLIYIITPSFNTFNDLEKLYYHLNKFDKDKFVWVIMDGGSVDFTKLFFSDKSSKWLIFDSEADYGIYDAINKGIQKYIPLNNYYVVSGSDDLPNVDNLYNVVNLDTISEFQIILGEVEYPINRIKKPEFISSDLSKAKLSFHSVGMVVNRSVHELLGYYSTKYVTASDEYFFQLALRDQRINFRLSKLLFGFYSNSGLSATDYLLVTTEMFYIKSKFFPLSFKDILVLFLRLCKYKISK
jgi:hypothetical protein